MEFGISYMISNGFQMMGCPDYTLVIHCFFRIMTLARKKERMKQTKELNISMKHHSA
jgi:hypothetical protein